jgi:hypothetical protein
MRYVKLLGTVAAGLLAVIAVAGAGSASATVLCKEATSPCPAGKRYEKGTEVAAESSSSLKSTFATVTCSTAKIMIKIKAESGKPLPAEVNTAEWEGCKDQSSNSCTVKATEIAWKASFEWISGSNAKLIFENPRLEFTCGKETCKYGAAAETGTFIGGEVFEIELGSTTLERQLGSGLACSTTATSATQRMASTKTYYGNPLPFTVFANF